MSVVINSLATAYLHTALLAVVEKSKDIIADDDLRAVSLCSRS